MVPNGSQLCAPSKRGCVRCEPKGKSSGAKPKPAPRSASPRGPKAAKIKALSFRRDCEWKDSIHAEHGCLELGLAEQRRVHRGRRARQLDATPARRAADGAYRASSRGTAAKEAGRATGK